MEGLRCLDLGASTGGFTDCLLQHGAVKVYVVDVGYGQLAYTLRRDSRVVVMERTNARYLSPQDFPERFDLVTVDVSFISLSKIFPVLPPLLEQEGQVLALIKPNFEVGKGKVGKRGVVREPQLHVEVLQKMEQVAHQTGLVPLGFVHSPLKGPEGNIEYFLRCGKGIYRAVQDEPEHIVAKAIEALGLPGRSRSS